ncbi:MAG TPA: CoA transferase [Longimicrobiaceae bacterium]|nr:CoA transferase [Longimicrobiaceae bacterium]
MPAPAHPLHGLTVVSLAANVPGPVAAARLRGLGARVVKVEPPAGDPLERYAPDWYRELADGQEVVRLDLKEPAGRGRLEEMLADADLLLTSFRLSALGRLGLAWEALHARHPRLSQVAIFGYPGAERDRAGHDLTYQATEGLLDPGCFPRTLLADLASAERAASAALALLLARERGGAAGYAEVALSDAAAELAAPLRHGLTAPGGLLAGGFPAYGVYPSREGVVAVAALEPHFASRLREELGLEELTRPALAAAFGARTAEEWEAWADARGLPVAAVRPPGS